jgi:pimeloyl-ACP methyl ester carboxylesterase
MFAWVIQLATLSCATAQHTAIQGDGFVEGPAGKLHVSDGGQGGVPVVFIHGLGSDANAWRDTLSQVRRSRRAIAYDQRGHGQSDSPRNGIYTIGALVEDLDLVARRLDLSKFVLVGHSFSGTVLTAYAAKHPDNVSQLIYVDAAGDVSDAPPEVKAQFLRVGTEPGFGAEGMRAAYAAMLGPLAKPETRQRVLDTAARTDVEAFRALRQSMANYAARADAKKYNGPRVAIEVAGTPGPWSASSAFGIPRRTLANVSHWLMMDDPQGFNALLDEVMK